MLRPDLAAVPARLRLLGRPGTWPLSLAPAVPRIRLGPGTARLVAAVGLPFAIYLAGGLISVLVYGLITPDAWSRLGNAFYVLYSRDPHLAAVGFVWNPLPSLVELPLLPLQAIWPAIVDRAVAASLMSAAFMALAVRELWRWLDELGTPRAASIGLVVAFAAHPMILLYGGNGMSEAPFLFFLVVAGRAFSAWLSTAEIGRLAVTGIALAFAYFTRYEAIAPIAAVILATAAVSFARAAAAGVTGRRARASAAVADALIVGAPPAVAFVLWALASWIIVGSPFETFSSVYGNSSQVTLARDAIQDATGTGPVAAFRYLLDQMAGLQPALWLVLAVGAIVALARRDLRIVAPAAIFGGVLGFSALAFLAGSSFGWLRFSIAVIPLAVIVAAVAASAAARPVARGWSTWAARLPGKIGEPARLAALTGLVALPLLALPVAVNTLFEPRLAREEAVKVAALVAPGRIVPDEQRRFAIGGAVADHLDAMNLPRGSVIVDVALGFWVVLQSDDPEQFVITPDRDFDRIATDPGAFDVRYLLVSPPAGLGGFGALERAHPGLYREGAGIATLAAEFTDPVDGDVAWRLYEVESP